MITSALSILAQRASISVGRRSGQLVLGVVLLAATSSSLTAQSSSWIFNRGQFSHDPTTGARVAQYSRIPPVEPLDDPRAITSVYRRSRTVLRGADGSTDTYYQVQGFGNGRGGLDAEWERFHDAWKESYTAGGYNRGQYGTQPYNYGYGNPHYGRPMYPHGGYPPYGNHPGHGGGRPVPYRQP